MNNLHIIPKVTFFGENPSKQEGTEEKRKVSFFHDSPLPHSKIAPTHLPAKLSLIHKCHVMIRGKLDADVVERIRKREMKSGRWSQQCGWLLLLWPDQESWKKK